MSKNDDELFGLFMVLFALSALVVLSALFLVLGFLQRLVWGAVPDGETGQRPVTLFGAPKSGWWTEQYERWLWRLEDITGGDFTSSPERLFRGSMLLAAGVGGPAALVAGAAIGVGDAGLFLPGFVIVFLTILLVCGLSSWVLSKPSPGWWEPVQKTSSERGYRRIDGIFLGELVDNDKE